MDGDRRWMYSERKGRLYSQVWADGVEKFVAHAFSLPDALIEETSRCPCSNCGCSHKRKREEMTMHLLRNGFQRGYERWRHHGEGAEQLETVEEVEDIGEVDRMDDMLLDSIAAEGVFPGEEPTPAAAEFYRLLEKYDTPVHDKTTQTTLSIVGRLTTIKSRHNMSEACYNEVTSLIHDIVGDEVATKIPRNFHLAKKLVQSLGMPYKKIDVCKNNCMLFYKENEDKDKCTYCGQSRYEDSTIGNQSRRIPIKVLRYLPITPRLQRRYMSDKISKYMTWHANHESTNLMVHPSDGEAWKEVDRLYPDFAQEKRNVRLGLATDGFTPFNYSSKNYTCWPVFIVPYNLPPTMCMKETNLILALVIPGPNHPGKNLNVFMEPLIDELLHLFEHGVLTYDSHLRKNFNMRAALIWTIHDFLAYGMVACWSTHGKLACPYCGGETKSFNLKHGHKACWFDCHRRFLTGVPHGTFAMGDGVIGPSEADSIKSRKRSRPNSQVSGASSSRTMLGQMESNPHWRAGIERVLEALAEKINLDFNALMRPESEPNVEWCDGVERVLRAMAEIIPVDISALLHPRCQAQSTSTSVGASRAPVQRRESGSTGHMNDGSDTYEDDEFSA